MYGCVCDVCVQLDGNHNEFSCSGAYVELAPDGRGFSFSDVGLGSHFICMIILRGQE